MKLTEKRSLFVVLANQRNQEVLELATRKGVTFEVIDITDSTSKGAIEFLARGFSQTPHLFGVGGYEAIKRALGALPDIK